MGCPLCYSVSVRVQSEKKTPPLEVLHNRGLKISTKSFGGLDKKSSIAGPEVCKAGTVEVKMKIDPKWYGETRTNWKR